MMDNIIMKNKMHPTMPSSMNICKNKLGAVMVNVLDSYHSMYREELVMPDPNNNEKIFLLNERLFVRQ